MSNLTGWHPGERLVRQKLGLDQIPSLARTFSYISGELPEEHSRFYTERLPFLPVCVLDDEDRPWGSILAGKDGKRGFIHYPRYNTLSIEAKMWEGEPFLRSVKTDGAENGSTLIAGVGVEVSTRRRNKFAGNITRVEAKEDVVRFDLEVDEAIGNCPKYITLRELTPFRTTSPVVVENKLHLDAGERLVEDAIALILESDTVWFGTTYAASKESQKRHPSHLGMNHRGGRPGFIRVKPSDGRTVVLPDFSGNRIMTSLGNVEATPLASLTFISFKTGDILYLTGNATNLYGAEARATMPFQDTLTEVFITGYTFVRNAFPAREGTGFQIQPSPYSPPVKLLAEESAHANIFALEQQPKASLTRITPHSPTIATFEWESSTAIRAEPGQAIILDFSTLLGSRQYQHMSPRRPSLVNDDFIRTWTISSAATNAAPDTNTFTLTMREKPGGVVTGALFTMLRKLSEAQPEMLDNMHDLSLTINIVGISGDFVLPTLPKPVDDSTLTTRRRLLWLAGGIGITPFLSMLSAISRFDPPVTSAHFEILFVISTREPNVILSLISTALGGENPHVPPYVKIHIFSNVAEATPPSVIEYTHHRGRVPATFFEERKELVSGKDTGIFICGPEPFDTAMLDALGAVGVNAADVHREGFVY